MAEQLLESLKQLQRRLVHWINEPSAVLSLTDQMSLARALDEVIDRLSGDFEEKGERPSKSFIRVDREALKQCLQNSGRVYSNGFIEESSVLDIICGSDS